VVAQKQLTIFVHSGEFPPTAVGIDDRYDFEMLINNLISDREPGGLTGLSLTLSIQGIFNTTLAFADQIDTCTLSDDTTNVLPIVLRCLF